jgi:uncharacterized protein (TIGR00251 family)
MARIRVRVTPRAARERLSCDPAGGEVRVWLAAPPVEGRANEALVRLLARTLAVPPRDVRVVRGETARIKTVEIDGLSNEEAWRRLAGDGPAP